MTQITPNNTPRFAGTPAFLDFPAVCHVLGLRSGRAARTWCWRNAIRGAFPAPVKLGPSRIAWRATDIEAFIASRKPVTYAKEAA
ncbi:MAG: AlpA family phage regulatory protein [Vicinamibacteria bacterium]|nr:AlpA family phage regulatory protein [Vicinamibacteria bacterium]